MTESQIEWEKKLAQLINEYQPENRVEWRVRLRKLIEEYPKVELTREELESLETPWFLLFK